jgi:hypothetical protein
MASVNKRILKTSHTFSSVVIHGLVKGMHFVINLAIEIMNLSTVCHHGYTTEKPNAGMISLCTLINLST